MDHVEALLLLHARPDHDFSVSEVAERVRLETGTAERVLVSLADNGLAAKTDRGFRFAASRDDENAVRLLEHAYHVRPVTLVKAIYSRRAAATSLSDVLRTRRNDDDAVP
jgi:hypothetical protein